MKSSFQIPKKILILSTGRTGTLFLASMLEKNLPEYKVFHESSNTRIINILSNCVLSRFVPKSFLRWFWRQYSIHEKYDRLIDSNNFLYAMPSLVPEVFKDYYIIHLYREPKSYAASHMSWSNQRLKSFIANYWIPFWQPNPVLLGEMSAIDWVKTKKIDKFLWIWAYKNRTIMKLKKRNRYIAVSFEKLFYSNPEKTIKDIFNFIGKDISPSTYTQLNTKKNASKQSLSNSKNNFDESVFNNYCMPIFRELE